MKSSLDDGSSDASWSIIEQFASENTNVKGVRFMRNLVNHKRYTLDLQKHKVMLLLWMLTYKIARKRFRFIL
jgi:hypothetical protein